jgi:hypothetical protein
MHHDGRGGGFMKAGKATNVVNVSMRAEDGADCKAARAEEIQDAIYFVAGIDDDGVAGFAVTQDRTVALEQSDGKNFVDEALRHTVRNLRRAV